jgi:hypothetical protein
MGNACDVYLSACLCRKECPDGYVRDGWGLTLVNNNQRTISNLSNPNDNVTDYYIVSREICNYAKSCKGYPTSVATYASSCNSPYTLVSGAWCVINP